MIEESTTDTPTAAPVQSPLDLILTLKEPVRKSAAEIRVLLTADSKGGASRALDKVGTVHFARFFFLDYEREQDSEPYPTKLAVVTAYDGDFQAYVQDFVNNIGDLFDLLLNFVEHPAGVVPVQKNAQAFGQWLLVHNPEPLLFYSAYPTLPVVQILRNSQGLMQYQ